MLIDFQDKTVTERYHLMTNVVVPRPIAWVMTESQNDGERVLNIAPFSYFTPISSEPATVVVSIGHRPDGSPKDTLRNLRAGKKCAICIVDKVHFEQMHLSAAALQPNESEVQALGIDTMEVLEGYPPLPAGIKAAMFGSYLQEVDLPGSRTIPVIIEITQLYIDEAVITDTAKMKLEIDAIARMGGTYRSLGEPLDTPETQ